MKYVFRVASLVLLLLVVLGAKRPLSAAGVVGNGTPGSCTESALNSALSGGGSVTFNCGANPVTITVTSQKTINADTTIDGGGLITISGGNNTRIFNIQNNNNTNGRRCGVAESGGGKRPFFGKWRWCLCGTVKHAHR